jgi:hypothetical protein
VNSLFLICSILSLVGFFSAFVVIAANVLRPSRKGEIESHALIPLNEERQA